MKRAAIRQLRTEFARVRERRKLKGHLIVTDQGRSVRLLSPYHEPTARRCESVDYYARIKRRMPKPLTASTRRVLHEAERDER